MEIELQQRFRASPERIFRAWTSPVALRQWWCPAGWVAGEIEIDLRVGGAYSIAMSRVGGGGTVSVHGQFRGAATRAAGLHLALGGRLRPDAGDAGDG
jgi:uncharacterized protein YndB with AHSA1/START domain